MKNMKDTTYYTVSNYFTSCKLFKQANIQLICKLTINASIFNKRGFIPGCAMLCTERHGIFP